MKLTTPLLSTVLAIVTLATASTQLVKNYCDTSIYLTLVDGSGTTTGPFELPSEEAYLNDIVGEGNDCKVTFKPDLWGAETAVFVLGTSTRDGILYWSVYDSNGDPFEGRSWNVTSDGSIADVCSSTTIYDGQVHACQDEDVTLTLNACWLAAL